MALIHRACSPNRNPGEQVTRNFLMQHLAHTDGFLLSNYHLPVGNSTFENDLILFNQRGVWILEVKNWRGVINIDQSDWQRDDGFIQHSPLISVETKAKALAGMLEHMGYTKISVVGLVVLSQDGATLKNTDDIKNREPHEHKILHLTPALIHAVTGKYFLFHKKESDNRPLTMKLMRAIVDKLIPLRVDPERHFINNSYRIQYDLGIDESGTFHAYQAEHVNIPGRYARAKKYNTEAISTGELHDSIEQFRRDMHVLNELQYHPNILQVYDYLPDRDSNDSYWLLLEWVKGITLRERLDYGPVPWQEQRRIINAVLEALDCCHNKKILHRNLNPSCIYLANDGTIKLGDFDFARVPNLFKTLTYPEQPAPWKASHYMAPELQTDAREADVRSDLYAVGAIWYDMLLRPEPNEEIHLSRLEETELHQDARDLLTRLLSPNPDDRPRSAKAVKRWLEQVQDQDTP